MSEGQIDTTKQINLEELKRKVELGEIGVKFSQQIEVSKEGKITLNGEEIGEIPEIDKLS